MQATLGTCYAFRDNLARDLEPAEATADDLVHVVFPVTEWRWSIYRVRIEPKSACCAERFAFIDAGSEQDACIRVAAAVAAFESGALDDIGIDDALKRVSAKSYEDCFRDGVSPDADRRLFELQWVGGAVTGWVHEPIFLLPRPSVLTLKWASILGTLLQ